MTDPGYPFSETYQKVIADTKDRILDGVERPESTSFVFAGEGGTYELPGTTYDVVSVTGWRTDPRTETRSYYVFKRDVDYRFADNRIVWLGPAPNQPTPVYPDQGSRFDVEYTHRDRPSGLTDFTPGSVVGTLVHAVARQMKLIYDQMDQAYRRAFIDEATGVALDNVVALLGVTRNPALSAKGEVTFSRRRAAPTPVAIPADTRVTDEEGHTFHTTEKAEIPSGETRVTVPVKAVQPGPESNVNTGTITIMPTPPRGVNGVVNEKPVLGGRPPEPDDQLRERAKHALERAGNATLNAIRFAVLDIDGVEGVEVIDHSVDGAVPLGEVRVRYSGGERAAVEQAVDQTRAAGVLARVNEITPILISGTFYLIPEPNPPATAADRFQDRVVEAINALAIGAPLSVRRLNALAYNVPGLAGVAEAKLDHNREGGGQVPDPFLVERSELVRPDEDHLKAVLVGALVASGSGNRIALQLMNAGEHPTPIEWRNLSLDVSVTLLAHAQNVHDQTPERIGSLTPTVTWVGTDTANLTITDRDITGLSPGFRQNDDRSDVQAIVAAAAYPGIASAKTTIDLSGT